MINQSVLANEEGRMVLPKEEDNQHRLVSQMRGYIIKSITARGDFTYEGEDHVLDSFHLAVYGFYHQFGILLKSSYDNKIKFMRDPRLDGFEGRDTASPESTILTRNNTPIRDPDAPPKYNRPRMIGGNKHSRGSNVLGTGFRRQF